MPGSDADRALMRMALALARRAVGTTAENPPVGCVIARDGVALGRGWTQPGGRPHAETEALRRAGAAAKGATAYVTLEPCSHTGKTPPCARALIEAGIARVVVALPDPDPRVSGRGVAMLREAGVAVALGLCESEAREIAAGFLSRITRGRPFLTLKLAATLDGRIATQTGESRWITGPQARARVHVMRAQSDALLVGAATVRADDPALDVRLTGMEARAPTPVILGRTPLDASARLAQAPHWTIGPEGAGADIQTPVSPEGLDLRAALTALGGRGINRVLCEGGGKLAASLLKAGLVDELVWFSAGAVIGAEGFPGLGGLGLEALDDAPRFTLKRAERIGQDLLSVWTPRDAP